MHKGNSSVVYNKAYLKPIFGNSTFPISFSKSILLSKALPEKKKEKSQVWRHDVKTIRILQCRQTCLLIQRSLGNVEEMCMTYIAGIGDQEDRAIVGQEEKTSCLFWITSNNQRSNNEVTDEICNWSDVTWNILIYMKYYSRLPIVFRTIQCSPFALIKAYASIIVLQPPTCVAVWLMEKGYTEVFL